MLLTVQLETFLSLSFPGQPGPGQSSRLFLIPSDMAALRLAARG